MNPRIEPQVVIEARRLGCDQAGGCAELRDAMEF